MHHIALSGRQLAEMAADVSDDGALRLIGARQDLGEIVDRNLDPTTAPAQRVDQLVARDGVEPGARGPFSSQV